MTDQKPLPGPTGASSGLGRFGYRRLSIAIMLVGAAGFIAALLLYGENLLCLSGSTLVTLGGLALLITARRLGLAPAPTRATESRVTGGRGRIPPALRRAAEQQRREARSGRGLARSLPLAPVIPINALPPQPPSAAGLAPGSLAARVTVVLESQSARVVVEQSLAGRAILRILLSDGQEYIAMVLEGGPAGTSEARALLALVERFGSGRGYLIAQEGFLAETYQWAAARGKIRLVGGDELDELGV